VLHPDGPGAARRAGEEDVLVAAGAGRPLRASSSRKKAARWRAEPEAVMAGEGRSRSRWRCALAWLLPSTRARVYLELGARAGRWRRAWGRNRREDYA
jgi:hypothetical protein